MSSTTGETFRQVGSTVTGRAGADRFTVSLFEAIAAGGTPTVTITMSAVPINAGTSYLDATLLDFGGVAEVGNVGLQSGAGAVVTAGPVQSLVADELIFSYAGSYGSISAANPPLNFLYNCFGDWSATIDAPTPAAYQGTFTQSSNAWATISVGLRPTVFDAGLADAGLADAGLADAGLPDAGLPDAGLSDAGLADAGLADAGLTDAGLTDAGPADAGQTPGEDGGQGTLERRLATVGCGCTTDITGAWVLGVLLLRRRPAA